jgi:hypothetical protein
MIILRLFGLLLIVVALMLLGADVVSTLEKSGATVIRSFGEVLLLLRIDAIPWCEEMLGVRLAQGIGIILSWPSWAVLGVPGAVLGMLASGPRQRSVAPPPLKR